MRPLTPSLPGRSGWSAGGAALATGALMAGCSSAAVTPAAVTPAAVTPAAVTPAASTQSAGQFGQRVGTRGVTVELPAGVVWTPDGERLTDTGARTQRWRYQPPGTGPACVVTIGEVSGYRGAFPAAALAALDGVRGEGVETVRNEAIIPPPAGAVAAVRQEQRFISARPAPAGTPGRLYARQLLTPEHTMIAVAAAAPDPAAAVCRPDQTVESLRFGREAAPSSSPPLSLSSPPGGTP